MQVMFSVMSEADGEGDVQDFPFKLEDPSKVGIGIGRHAGLGRQACRSIGRVSIIGIDI